MISIINCKGKIVQELDRLERRTAATMAENVAAEVIREVRTKGDAAVRFYTKKFDGVSVHHFAVSHREIKSAKTKPDVEFIAVLRTAAANIRKFHQAQRRKSFVMTLGQHSELRQIYRPIEKVGVYVPGGKAAYPSTVLMNVIPAQVAGVKEIHLVSPPDKHGNIHPDVLLAASILGVKNIYRVGGAQAIAALAYGTKTIPAVDKIVGPGNMFVAAAKKLVFGKVGIDSIAGPSEIVILADETANPAYVAADLMAQAEHDESAVAILVTPSRGLADKVNGEVRKMVKDSQRKNIIIKSLKQHGKIYLVTSLKQGIEFTNALAPEHLEIITAKNESVLKQIQHAGSIFLGNYSPVALGDYFAGPNHVLPTERTARFSSPLSVDDFIKKSSVVRYSQKKMASVADDAALFAEREGLSSHAASLRIRKNN